MKNMTASSQVLLKYINLIIICTVFMFHTRVMRREGVQCAGLYESPQNQDCILIFASFITYSM